jgi:hypothetical protein
VPLYEIINKKTKKVHTEFLSISEMAEYEAAHPNEEVLCGAPGVAYKIGTKVKVDNEFKDRLREIKKSHRGSTIDV